MISTVNESAPQPVVAVTDERLQQGRNLFAQGRFAEAAIILLEPSLDRPDNETRLEWAIAELAATNQRAEHSFRRALSLDPGHSQALVNLCTLLAGLGRELSFDEPVTQSSQEHIEACESLLQSYPRSFPSKYEGRADGMFWLSPGAGMLSVSVDSVLQTATVSVPAPHSERPENRCQTGLALLRDNRYADASQHFDRALSDPEDCANLNADVWNNFAVAQLAAGLQLAHHEFQRALNQNPSNLPIRMHLAALLVRLGRDREALTLLDAAAPQIPSASSVDSEHEGFTVRKWRAACRGELPSIIFYGNCNAPILADALAGLPEVRENYEPRGFTTFPLPGASQPEPPSDDMLARCELLFLQVEAKNAAPPFVEKLADLGVKVVRFPITSCEVLWPQACTDSRNNAFDERYPWGRYPYGDRVLIDLISQGGTPDEIVDKYLATDLARMFHVNRVYEYWRKKIAKLDLQCDVKLGPFLDEQFPLQRLFFTHNHPAPPIMAYLLREMIRMAWGDVVPHERIAAAAASVPLDRNMSPVHPSIAAALGLQWCNDDLLYRHYENGFFTLREIVRRYVMWEG